MTEAATQPSRIQDIAQLEDLLSRPSDAAVQAIASLRGDIMLLGAGGKMGPTLAMMTQRATQQAGVSRRVVAVSRFSNPAEAQKLQRQGIQTIRADLLDESQRAALPDAPNIIYMTGQKFGTTGQAGTTWAMNVLLPAMVCRRFRDSRFIAFSSGNVYGLVPVAGGGSRETDEPLPVGEYAMSALGRERMFEHFSQTLGIAVSIIRLNYACEMRYGVLVDVARRVWAGEEVDLAMGYLNTIWQGDANAMSLAAFADAASPPFIINVTGPELVRVRDAAARFGELMKKPVRFRGVEAPDALLNDATNGLRRYGQPRVSLDQMMQWIADWVMRGGESLNKPTHFESRDGRF